MPSVPLPEIAVFSTLTAVSVWFSWSSLRRPRSYGFYRFFAFEAIALLLVLNGRYWFVTPLAIHQLASWFLLSCSLVVLVPGLLLLRAHGRPRARVVEETSRLVKRGIFGYIRHPLYGSLLYLAWGITLKHPSVLTIALGVGATAALIVTARIEEKENLRRFGDEYAEYMKSTRMFVPFVF